jgi:carbon storage regulator
MLVLSRKAGERIRIGPEVELTVLGIHGGRVKLGFAGPPEVPIHRDELLQRAGPEQTSHVAVPSSESSGRCETC